MQLHTCPGSPVPVSAAAQPQPWHLRQPQAAAVPPASAAVAAHAASQHPRLAGTHLHNAGIGYRYVYHNCCCY